MQIIETNADGLRREFKVVIPSGDIEQRVITRLKEIGRSLQLPGSGKDKAPITTLKRQYGSAVMGEVLERAIIEITSEALRIRNLRPVLLPHVEIAAFEEGTDFEVKLVMELLPEIQPVEFGKLRFERLRPELSEDAIQAALECIAREQRKRAIVERAAEIGDALLIDFNGTIDGKEFPGSVADGYLLEWGSGSFIPGFEDHLLGVKAGDTRTVILTFPPDFGANDLAGKTSNFEVKVKEVRALQPQPLDDSLAQAVGLESLDQLRQTVSEQIESDYEEIARQRLRQSVLDSLVECHDFAVPVSLVEVEFGALWSQYKQELAALKPSEGNAQGDPVDETREKTEYRRIAERRVRLGLILSEVGRRHNIMVTADEINRVLTAQAQRFPGQERRVIDHYRQHPELIDLIRAPIFEDKVIQFILDRALVGERRVPLTELQEKDGDKTSLTKVHTKSDHPASRAARTDGSHRADLSDAPKRSRGKKPRRTP